MHRVLLLATLTACAAVANEVPAERTVRDLVLTSMLQLPELELRACTATHPGEADRYEAAVAQLRRNAEQALVALAALRSAELETPVPSLLFAQQDVIATLHGSESAMRSSERCNRWAQELMELPSDELYRIADESASAAVAAVARYAQDMERVLR